MKKCAHKSRTICLACALQTAIFPIEHFIWSRLLGPVLGIAL